MLKGSEKQIAWAEDIINNFRESVESFKRTLDSEKSLIPEDQKSQVLGLIDEAFEKLNNMHAGTIINHRSTLLNVSSYIQKESEGRNVMTGELEIVFPETIENIPEFQKQMAVAIMDIVNPVIPWDEF
jgi:hypothetical protein